jgi:hypothetical protein
MKVQSAIGNSNFQGSGPKRYVVGEEISPSVAAGLRRQAEEAQHFDEQRHLNEARRRIDLITGLGRKTKDVEINTEEGSIVFTLRSLKTFEQNCLAQVIEQANRITLPNGRTAFAPTSLYEIKIEALTHALFLIDGQSVDVVLGTVNEPFDAKVSARQSMIRDMDGALVDHLFIKYEELSKETYDGYAPRTAEEAKEVVETIRKSGENA